GEPTALRAKHAEGSAMRLRRNTRLKIYNSVFAGWGRGVRIESEGSFNSAFEHDSLTVQNTIVAQIRGVYFQTDASAGENGIRNWFMQEKLNNDTLSHIEGLKINDPFNYTTPNFQPLSGSPVLCGSIWASSNCGTNTINRAEADESFVFVYPNPVETQAILSVNLNENALVGISVFDVNGKLINSIDNEYAAAGVNSYTFDVSFLSAGVYYAKVTVNNNHRVIKILVK
ncbi:MAG: T9SS type A sorting domain-containing protein, partial [Bacteroidales bacterium]|nr:T9SS type A sorting domain-containing protein [Bacteroidales bacterium]